MIKNNLKLMLRFKAIILFVVIMVMVTGLLSSIFKEMMNDNFEIKKCTAGFSFSQNCKFKPYKDKIKSILDKNGIESVFYENASVNKLTEESAVDIFVEISDNGCTVSSYEDYAKESGVVKMIVYSIIFNTSEKTSEDYTNQYMIKVDPMPDSQLYYTIAYIVYFIWVSMIVLGIVISSERKNKIGSKLRCSPVSALKIYLSRFVPTSIVISLLIGISAAICTPLFSINWQTPLLSSFIVFLGCIASAAVGTVVFSFVKNTIVSIALIYSIVMFWGFFGGAFASYIIASFADDLRNTSPIYYMIRSLVELNTMGHSDYTLTAILILCAIISLCIPLGILAIKFRKES